MQTHSTRSSATVASHAPQKTAKPRVFDISWRTATRPSVLKVSLQKPNQARAPEIIPAVVLFPAFLTPGVHLRCDPDSKGMFEVLLVGRGAPAITPEIVNQHLRVVRGLDPRKRAGWKALFDPEDPKFSERIVVRKITSQTILETASKRFRGILDKRFRDGLPKFLDTFYEVQVHESCLDLPQVHPQKAKPARPGRASPVIELQDLLLEDVLRRLNGRQLGGRAEKPKELTWDYKGGWVTRLGRKWDDWVGDDDEPVLASDGPGLHAFRMAGTRVDLGSVDLHKPVRAHHLLFVYPEGSLKHANIGHASDLHINSRQPLLSRTKARVIDMGDDDPNAAADSPEIGGLFNDCGANFASILQQLGERADLALVGGDLIDHVKNVYTFGPGASPSAALVGGKELTAREVWDLVELEEGQHYQPFVDHLTFYTIVLDHCQSHQKPVFVVNGNHDAYNEAFGISPRVMDNMAYTKRANEGIPADNNLTFYEAILAFGKSYGEIKASFNFEAELFEWFYSVFTPWSDFAVSLPHQRVVGLAWGDAEKMISAPYTGHGFGHLPRADKAISGDQLALFRDGLSAQRKSILFTHFTFVSYGESLPNCAADKPYDPRAKAVGKVILETDFVHQNDESFAKKAWRKVKSAPRDVGNWWAPYTQNDYGTFQDRRTELYKLVADADKVQCVLTGHSHRKGLYFLEQAEGDGYRTAMYAMAEPVGAPVLPAKNTPIVVSDCAGPLPRMNLHGEFLEWGSDRPAGTVVRVDPESGKVVRVSPVASQVSKPPRLAVALEYLHVMKEAVFDGIQTRPFQASKRLETDHALYLDLRREFRENVVLEKVTLYGKASVKPEARWMRIVLEDPRLRAIRGLVRDGRRYEVAVPADARAAFLDWLQLPDGAGRFLSLKFRIADPVAQTFDEQKPRHPSYNAQDPWNFEVDCRMGFDVAMANAAAAGEGFVPSAVGQLEGYTIVPRMESPSFAWREKFPKYTRSHGASGSW